MLKKRIAPFLLFLLSLSLSCSNVNKLIPGLSQGMSAVLASGWQSNCILRGSDPMKCWGGNEFGQLGDNTIGNNNAVPVDVTVVEDKPSAVALGKSHACILTTKGGVKCWGDNAVGQLGDGTNKSSLQPVDVVGLSSGVISIAANQLHTCAVTKAGGVKCWGQNSVGELGDGSTVDRNIPVDVQNLSEDTDSIALGAIHACAVRVDGKVFCWGWNVNGQLGDGSTADSATPVEVKGLSGKVTAVAAGWSHTCGITSDSKVQCWGGNYQGQLGDGTTDDSISPVNVVGMEENIQKIVSGDFHVCVLLSTGGVKCWGENYLGQVGNGTTDYVYSQPMDVIGLNNDKILSISAGGGHTCALFEDGGVQCWGWNAFGQLGNGSIANSTSPVDVVWSPDKAADPFALNIRTLKAAGTVGVEGANPGELKSPRGIAVAPDGSVYVADTFNHRIQHGDSDGNLLHLWGSESGDTAETGTFNEPWGIAVGPDGSVYVADTWNNRIQKFTAEGDFITAWGDQLYGPRSVAVDSQGRVFVADTGNKRIMVYDENGGFLMQIGDPGSGPGQFDEPVGIAFGSGGRVYIADAWNKRIQVFQETGQQFVYQSEWAVKSWADENLDNKPYLAVAPDGNVWATDPWAGRVLVFDPTGGFLFSFGHPGSDDYSFTLPSGIAISADGNAYIADAGNNRVMEFLIT